MQDVELYLGRMTAVLAAALGKAKAQQILDSSLGTWASEYFAGNKDAFADYMDFVFEKHLPESLKNKLKSGEVGYESLVVKGMNDWAKGVK